MPSLDVCRKGALHLWPTFSPFPPTRCGESVGYRDMLMQSPHLPECSGFCEPRTPCSRAFFQSLCGSPLWASFQGQALPLMPRSPHPGGGYWRVYEWSVDTGTGLSTHMAERPCWAGQIQWWVVRGKLGAGGQGFPKP